MEIEKLLELATAKVQALENELVTLHAKRETLTKENKVLRKKQTIESDNSNIQSLTFTHKASEYRFRFPKLRIGKEVISAQDAIRDEALLRKIVEEYPYFIQEIKK